MSPHTAKNFAIALVPSIFTLLLVQACGGSSDAIAQAADQADPLEGVWESNVTIRDCTSGAVLRTFKGMQNAHRGGTLSDTNNAPTASRGPGMGLWRKQADGSYLTRFRFYRYNPDGSFAGSQRVSLTTTLTSANQATGTVSAQVLDADDNVLQTLCGTTTSVRVFQ